MGAVRVNGSTSGYVELAAPAVAGSVVLTLPATTGTLAVQGYAYGQSATATVATQESTTSATYTDLATVGPAVTLVTGTKVLVCVAAGMFHNTSGQYVAVAMAVSGATTRAAQLFTELRQQTASYQWSGGASWIITGLTAGSNTFTLKYNNAAGGGTAYYYSRFISVIDLGS